MARFSTAAKALRGPFKRLVRKLELGLRKPVVKRWGPVGRRIDARFRAKDSETAHQAALAAAGERRAAPGRLPVATSAAVDRRTGRVVGIGYARDQPDIPPSLERALPKVTVTKWPVKNCGEVSAASTAIRNGSRLEDLVIRTVRTREGVEFPPCGNCKTWIPGED